MRLKLTRSQQVLAVALSGVGVCFLALATLLPLHHYLADLKLEYADRQKSLLEMHALSTQIQQLASSAGARSPADSLSLNALVSAQLNAAALQPVRMQQDGSNEMLLRFENESFARLLPFIHALEQAPDVLVENLSVVTTNAGNVSASVNVRLL